MGYIDMSRAMRKIIIPRLGDVLWVAEVELIPHGKKTNVYKLGKYTKALYGKPVFPQAIWKRYYIWFEPDQAADALRMVERRFLVELDVLRESITLKEKQLNAIQDTIKSYTV